MNVARDEAARRADRPLGDAPERSYATKLELFNRFAEPELRRALQLLDLRPGMRVLDAGCGVGLTTGWLAELVAPRGAAVGLELSLPHLREARRLVPDVHGASALFVQGDISRLPLLHGRFDAVWTSNVIHHVGDAVAGVRALASTLRSRGTLAVGQSGFLPEMLFAWDERLEREVLLACRRYYRDKYGLDERATSGLRNLVGLLQSAGLRQITASTVVVERTAPLSEIEQRYIQETVFEGYWGSKVRPYLHADDWSELQALCDPASPSYCLRRPDFHHIQTYTVVRGRN
jgi:SAM-dependent methyltransferase